MSGASNAIPVDDWLRHIDSEYLSTFVKGGGSSVKFAVVPDDALPGLRDALAERGAALDYVFISLDATRLRVHMPQDIFFELARQVEWRSLARRVILRLAAERDYVVDAVDPDGDGNVFDAIAGANDIESQFLLSEIRPAIQECVFRNPNMARDFRVAMTQLCLQEGRRFDGEYGGQPLLDWLTGANTRVSPVRQFSIYTGDRSPQSQGRLAVLHASHGRRSLRAAARVRRRHRPSAGNAAVRHDLRRVSRRKLGLPRLRRLPGPAHQNHERRARPESGESGGVAGATVVKRCAGCRTQIPECGPGRVACGQRAVVRGGGSCLAC